MVRRCTFVEILLLSLISTTVGQQAIHDTYKDHFVKEHNKYRLEDVNKFGANNMQKLVWSDALANKAATWARNCVFEHRPMGLHKEGENLFFTTRRANTRADTISLIDQGFSSWYTEITDYDYNSNSCVPGKMCGHYTQMVWGTTKEVGCSMHRCRSIRDKNEWLANNAWYLVCFYNPPGNYHGEKPYTKGVRCGDCDPGQHCDKGLCTDGTGVGAGSAGGNTFGNGNGGNNIPERPVVDNTITTGNTGTSGSPCVDGSAFCNVLRHLCHSNSPNAKTSMQKYCRKTCGFCPKETPVADNCLDKSRSCPFLKLQGLCLLEAFRTTMSNMCPKTCGLCNSGVNNEPTNTVTIIRQPGTTIISDNRGTNSNQGTDTGSSCMDIDPKCSRKRWQSFCQSKDEKRLTFMKKNCAKTCGFCLGPSDPQLNSLITDAHNDYRRQHRASNMNMLRWNKTLEEQARNWVSTCTYPKDRPDMTGQNLAFHQSTEKDSVIIKKIMEMWYKDSKEYDFRPKLCFNSCPNTQIVWAETTDIGCGFRRCDTLTWDRQKIKHAWLMTCLYTPPGNRYNRRTGVYEHPYKRGPACSECDRGRGCTNGLCS